MSVIVSADRPDPNWWLHTLDCGHTYSTWAVSENEAKRGHVGTERPLPNGTEVYCSHHVGGRAHAERRGPAA